MRAGRLWELLSGATPARVIVRHAGRERGGWEPMPGGCQRVILVDASWEADPFSPEDREQLRDEAERLGVTPELVQPLDMIEDPDGLWRDRETGE